MKNKIELVRATSKEDYNLVYQLRYFAYQQAGDIKPNKSQLFKDEYDELPNTFSYLLKINDELIGTIRECIYKPSEGIMTPSMSIYKEEIIHHIGLEKTIVEANRFAISPWAKQSALNILFLYRANVLNILLNKADYTIAAVKNDYLDFYCRQFHYDSISQEKNYTGLKEKTSLLSLSVKERFSTILKRMRILNISAIDLLNYNINGTLTYQS